MEPNKILSADLLDIVFEGRNKEYGAYDLRKKYNKRITMALVITASVAALVVGATFLSKALGPSTDDTVEVKDVALQNIQEAPPPPPAATTTAKDSTSATPVGNRKVYPAGD